MRANHNCHVVLDVLYEVVINIFKDTKWEQITTLDSTLINIKQLLSIFSKIRNESKSQLWRLLRWLVLSCYQYFQRYEMRANHNCGEVIEIGDRVVINIFKDTKWEQITTFSLRCSDLVCCYQYFQRYEMRANHNQLHPILLPHDVVINIFKDTKWEQITTVSDSDLSLRCCYQYFQRYEMRANHNKKCRDKNSWNVVINIFKDTKWEQITTPGGW